MSNKQKIKKGLEALTIFTLGITLIYGSYFFGVDRHEQSHLQAAENYGCENITVNRYEFLNLSDNTVMSTSYDCDISNKKMLSLRSAQSAIEGAYPTTTLYLFVGFLIFLHVITWKEIRKVRKDFDR